MLTVNLTTTHSRLHLCSATVWSLMNQSLKPDFIVLWVSRDSYLSDEGISKHLILYKNLIQLIT